MNMGQQHYTSTAITYNGHWGRVGDVGGMIAITGCSGVFINPFGIQGFVDGAEILYPPEIITTYEGQNPTGFQEHGVILPVFHLKEVNSPETGQKIVEDQDFAIRRPRGKDLYKRKMALVDLVEKIVGQYGKDILTRARGESGVNGDMMYLTIDDLVRLCYSLEIAVRDQIEQPQKLALIEKIEAIIAKYGTAVWQKARAATGLNGPVLYLTLEQLNILFNQLQTYIK